MKEVVKQLDKFWFGYGSPVTMGVFRILASTWILANFVFLLPYATDFFGERSYVPIWAGSRYMPPVTQFLPGIDIPRIDVLSGVTDMRIYFVVHVLTIVLAAMTLVGLWTRVSSISLAILVISFHHRNAIILHGGDSVFRMSAIYMALAPSGAAVSLDRWFARKNGTAPLSPPEVSLWPQRLVALNLSLIYFTTIWAKWFGTLWRNGTATWFPARLNEFKKFPVPDFVNQLPGVYIATYGTLFVEFSLGVLVWFRPLRKWVLLAGLLMHGFIEYSMNVPLFAFAITSMYVAFYDGEEITSWWDKLKVRFGKSDASVVAAAPVAPGQS